MAADGSDDCVALVGAAGPDGLGDFDATFFCLTPSAAAEVGPSRRVQLQLCWAALEDAGVTEVSLGGRRIAIVLAGDPEAGSLLRRVDLHQFSRALRLRGNGLVVDVAQSSSLGAVRAAIERLRAGEIDVAVAGGVDGVVVLDALPGDDRAHCLVRCATGGYGSMADVVRTAVTCPDGAEVAGLVFTPAPVRPRTHGMHGPVAWVLSAPGEQALADQARALRDSTGENLADVGFSLATGRTAFSRRAAVVGQEPEDFRRGLDALADGVAADNLVTGVAAETGKVVFVFPGQGPQWPGMAAELLDSSEVFRTRIEECAAALESFVDWPLLDVLREVPGAPSLDRVDVVQPTLFAVMVSLAALWRSVGVVPDAVLGHSLGEIAAACDAGALSIEDGARVAALWSKQQRRLSGSGDMVSVFLPVDEVERRLVPWGDRLVVAAVNGPGSVVVSGEVAAVDTLLAELTAEGVRARKIPVGLAAHSPQIDRIRDEVLSGIAEVAPMPATTEFFSSLAGGPVDGAELDAAYWYRSLRHTVRFGRAIGTLIDQGHRTFIEISPHPGLTFAIQDSLEEAGVEGLTLSTLRRGDGGASRFTTAVAEAHVRGVPVDWNAYFAGTGARRTGLPGHVFPDAAEPVVVEQQAVRPEGPFADMPPDTWADWLLALVRRAAAAVVGREVPVDRTFLDLGFDSLSIMKLRNEISAATGLRLPVTIAFDHPTPAALAAHLLAVVRGSGEVPGDDVVAASATDEPIAIVGMSCRAPGGVQSPDDLWRLVFASRDVTSDLPSDRGWDEESLRGTYARRGGFLHDAAMFDPDLFGISPREAMGVDPQQRLVLEASWEALENAGVVPGSLRGTRTGVFLGVIAQDYGPRMHEAPEHLQGHLATGTLASVASGRVAYTFGFEGPAITIDTACSSSLVAVHLAVESLRRGECTLALAGGVTVMAGPGWLSEFSRQGGLSPDGRCRAFGAGADGFGMAEGVGLLLVERLSDAVRNGHRVLAVVRGSAVNQDGASNGLTAPSGVAQQRVIRQALANARLSAVDVDVVEAHGTGTSLGDPIEAGALLATYGQGRERPLLLGSVKSNIGHTQAAAGVIGMIKMVEAMRHEVLPRTLHVDEPSPHIDWSSGEVRLLTEPVSWVGGGRPRRAGVSSFGISGTNAHVVLEEPPAFEGDEPLAPGSSVLTGGVVPWVVSARDERALAAQAKRLGDVDVDADVVDVAWSLVTTRGSFERRAVVFGSDRAELLDGLSTGSGVRGVAGPVGKTVFVFPGQGGQWAGMAAGLLDSSPVFVEWISRCERALSPFVEWSLVDVLRAAEDAPGLDRVDVVQPVLWAVMVSLAGLWRASGVVPDAVVGHSQGEIAAACVAGALSLSDGARVVALRSRALLSLTGAAGMVSVEAAADDVRTWLAEWGDRIEVAAVNGPAQTVIAGDDAALEEFIGRFEDSGVRVRRIPVTYASHTRQVEQIREAVLESLEGVVPRQPMIPWCSATEVGVVPEGDAAYWYENLRRTVCFQDAVQTLHRDGHSVFIEVSPHPVLTPSVAHTLDASEVVVAGTLRRGKGDGTRFLTALAEVFVRGVTVDWAAVLAGRGGRRVELPTYAFQRRRFWVDTGTAARPEAASSLRYGIVWRSRTARPAALSGDWLVVVPAGAAGDERTAAIIQGLGARGLVVDETRIDRVELAARLREEATGVDGVVSLLALGAEPATGSLSLVQALGDAEIGAPLWLVTSGAVRTGRSAEVVRPDQALVWGLGRVAGLEHPERWGGLIDLPETGGGEELALLAGLLADPDDEDQLAIRGPEVLVRRLVRAPAAVAREPWKPRGTVLVTGGTGGVGGEVARWLAAGGAEHLVLLSRRGPEAEGAAELEAELVASGARVSVVACDVADRDALAEVLAGLEAEGQVLRAVFHAAGVPELSVPLMESTVDGFAAVVDAKVSGTVHLDELLGDRELDACVLFSSGAGVWGGGGQGAYAAGNAFLDAFAESRRARGLPATSVAWGVWDRRGMAADAATEEFMHRRGLRGMSPGTAIAELQRALDLDDTFVTVADVDWERFAASFTSARRRPLLDELAETRQHTAVGRTGGPADLSSAERERVVPELVRAATAAVLGHADATGVDVDRTFRDLGFDSLTVVELRDELARTTGLRLPSTLAFDFPTVRALTGHVLAQLGSGLGPEPAPAAVVVDPGEPIAIVATACRFPGGIRSAEDLWRFVDDGGDAIADSPLDRGWDVTGLRGGFLPDAAGFDAEFFGISPREALSMDPQQRLLLETSWEVLERAGIDPAAMRGTRTGVFAGCSNQGYGQSDDSGFRITGGAGSVVSGRVAYALGLEGPAITVDTACSSSLVALHLAAQSLRQGECELALAGGVTVMAHPDAFAEFDRQGGLSSDGRCKAFAAQADGTGWSEGVGMVLLERLSDAVRNGHRVLALVAGSAVNSDGASNGLTAPNGLAQQRVIQQALANAGLEPSDVDVVEAHGTGTRLGDPIEAQALLATYGQRREVPLWLGTLKSNIGHTQAAAGVAGVIKMVESVRRGVLPRTLHVDEPSPYVDWSAGAVELLTGSVEWPEAGRPRRAGVSSFGISGTNAHMIIEQAAVIVEPLTNLVPPSSPWMLSGRTPAALTAQARRLLEHLISEDVPVADVGATLASRSALEHRAVVVGGSPADLLHGLAALAGGDAGAAVVRASAREHRLAMLFSGQGAQRLGMGRGLYEAFPVFAGAFDAVCAQLDALLGCSLRAVVWGDDEAELSRTSYTQAGLFAVEVALFRLVEHFGVCPDFVAGHSVGEVAAAHVAGVLSLQDACVLVAARGRLMGALPSGGVMVAVQASEDEVVPLLPDGVSVAAVNGPSSVVLSGPAGAVAEAEVLLQGRKVKRLHTSHAFHSSLMDPVLAEFAAVVSGLTFSAPRIPLVSNVSGAIAGDEVCTPEYWVRHVRETVRFADGVRALQAGGATAFLELGPDGVLTAMAHDSVCGDAVLASVLRAAQAEPESLVAALARLHVNGVIVDWRAFYAGVRRAELPTYEFQHEHYWMPDAPRRGDVADLGLTATGHPLLGVVMSDVDDDGLVVTGALSSRSHRWLEDHVVAGEALVPGTAFLEMAALAAGHAGAAGVAELVLETPLVVRQGENVQVRIVVAVADPEGRRTVTVHSRLPGTPWVRNASGELAEAAVIPPEAVEVWPPADADALAVEDLYDRLAVTGLDYGPAFRGLTAAWTRAGELFVEVRLPDGTDPSGFGVHPALLDAALHGLALGVLPVPDGLCVPFTWSGASVYAGGARTLRARLRTARGEAVSLEATDADGVPIIKIDSVTLRRTRDSAASDDAMFRVEWTPLEIGLPPAQRWTVLGDDRLTPVRLLKVAGIAVERVETAGAANAPDCVVVGLSSVHDADLTGAVHEMAANCLELLRSWLADERTSPCTLVIVTSGAVSTGTGEDVGDLVAAPVWGLIRSAQTENPGRIVVVDVDSAAESVAALPAAVASGEPELALRDGVALGRRLVRAALGRALVPPAAVADWRLDTTVAGALDGLALVPGSSAAPGPGEIRIAVRAAGVNFRDVLIALDMYPEAAEMGSEGAGVVVEVGSDVTRFAPGDRVMGMFQGAFGPFAVADQRTVVRMPSGWSFARAASVPVAFLTACYGLVDLAGLQPGESVLVHAAAGGVGTAAVQFARHLGAEVFGTASPAKWPAVDLDEAHLASSRTLDFEERFRETTGGKGVDVVLDSLAGEYVDASLRLVRDGGRFVEMGKTDVRDPAEVAARHPGVWYRSFDLAEAGPERIGEMLAELVALCEAGVLRPPPVTTWDVRRAPEAFRALSQATLVGKAVLTMPPVLDPGGTVLVTGGTGVLGGLVARHLVAEHGVRHLVLAGRRPRQAERLQAELLELGADVTLAACDVTDRSALADLLAGIPAQHPLVGVVHAAGVLDDGVIGSLSPEQLAGVLRPKADAAWHLHELTAHLDLSLFALFSSAAATTGTAGQGNYAAANAFLDALAEHRHHRGRAATSLAWGLWAERSAMTGHLGDVDLQRVSRAGVAALTTQQGLALFDTAITSGRPALVPMRLALRGDHDVPALFRSLVRSRAPRRTAVATGESFATRLVALPADERHDAVLELVRVHVASVLGHTSPDLVDAGRAFKETGFDSLTAVELRNLLQTAVGRQLPATLVFDHPSPDALAAHLTALLAPEETSAHHQVLRDLDVIDAALSSMEPDAGADAEIEARLRSMLRRWSGGADDESVADRIHSATAGELLEFIESEFSDLA